MTRLKDILLGFAFVIFALSALGFFASIGLAVLGLIAAFTLSAVVASWMTSFVAEKRGQADT